MTRLAFLVGLVALAATGCKTVPTADTVYLVAHAGGSATALVMNETKLDADKRTVIRDIVNEIRECTPEVGQTLEAAWTPVAQRHVDLLVEEGRIDSAAATLIMTGFKTVMVGVNAIENRYPQIRANRDLLSAFVTGFTDGFLARFDVYRDEDDLRDPKFTAPVMCDHDVVTEVRRAAVRNNLK